MFGWLFVYGRWCDIQLLVRGCVRIGCCPGVGGPPLGAIVVWCQVW